MKNQRAFKKLFEPSKIGNMTLINRLVMPAMGTNYGSEEGYVTERLINYYKERANGGPGLIIPEVVSIDSPAGQRGSHQLRIDGDSYVEGLSQLTRQIHNFNRKIAIQLCHAGILGGAGKVNFQPVAPSPVNIYGRKVTEELTSIEIEDIIDHFVKAAMRARDANFDGVEIHAAHNYLLAHFLSPFFNKRRDDFGGSLEKRARILSEIIGRIRKLVGKDFPLWCRMNAMEYGIQGGLTIDEAKLIARMAQQSGSDAIHVSGYGYGLYASINRANMGEPRGNLADLAIEIKKVVNIPVIAVGRIDLKLGEKLVGESKIDLIAMGRSQIADPHLVRKAAKGRLDDIRPCISCNVCVDDLTGLDASLHCSVNACVGKEKECEITPAQRRKRVLVIGGGPGGMEAAIVAANRGHDVTIYEKLPQLGGKLILASKPPHKDEIQPFTNYLITQIEKSGAKVQLGEAVVAKTIKKFKPDAVILATGATSLVPRIPGVNGENVVFAEDILSGKEVGQTIVVIGGGLVGCETAEFLVQKGKVVTIVEMLNEIAIGIGLSFKPSLINRLAISGVTMLTGWKCEKICEIGVIIANNNGEEQTIEANTIVLAVGAIPANELLKSISDLGIEIHSVGDCIEPRRIIDAISDGNRIGLLV